jgi:hypothetical protein
MSATLKERINLEQTTLRKCLGDEEKYRLCYLGGGDYLVHVMGIDPEIDQTVRTIEVAEAEDEGK